MTEYDIIDLLWTQTNNITESYYSKSLINLDGFNCMENVLIKSCECNSLLNQQINTPSYWTSVCELSIALFHTSTVQKEKVEREKVGPTYKWTRIITIGPVILGLYVTG